MGCLLRLVLALALVAGLALAADGYVAGRAESRAGGLATAAVGGPTSVELPGRPFLLHVLRGRFPRVVLHARDVPVAGTGATVRRLDLVLREVRLSLGALLDGSLSGGELPEAEAGTFTAVLDEAALRVLLGAPDELDLRIAAGEVRVRVAGQVVAVTPVASDGGIWLGELPGAPALGADLAGLPGGPWIEDIRVELGAIVLSGTLRGL